MPRVVNYVVDVRELVPALDRFINGVTERARDEALDRIKWRGQVVMMEECPSSLKSGRGYRGPPLRFSIKGTKPDSETVKVGPTKRVDGYDLGAMMELGSNNPVLITPKNRKFLKFMYRGKVWFKKAVRRGIIPPNPFVKRTTFRMRHLIPKIVLDAFMDVYQSEAP